MKKKKYGRPGSQGRKIIQGGLRRPAPASPEPDIVLQMPDLFLFNMRDYMESVRSARSIDWSYRVRLYDMYESAMLDLHLSGVLDKRLRGVTRLPVQFLRQGKVDEDITRQLRSQWFKRLRKDLVLSKFWGFTLVQFYTDGEGNLRYDLIDRKHYDPVFRKLLKYQGDQEGISIDQFDNMLFVGEERSLGIFAELLPAVLYKRGNMSDWAKFCNIFGMPIREYTYDAGDEQARRKILADARIQGTNAVYIHPNESEMNLIEAGNKTGSAELYQKFTEYWDAKISIRVLGNTLTTDAKDKGTQALGTVHKEEEDDMNADDRDFLLDILNYDMKTIFTNLGFNVEGGEFAYVNNEKTEPQTLLNIVQGMQQMGLPLDDDWLYEQFGIEKPKDYDRQKQLKEERRKAVQQALEQSSNDVQTPLEQHPGKPRTTAKGSIRDRLNGFFGIAPTAGADTDF